MNLTLLLVLATVPVTCQESAHQNDSDSQFRPQKSVEGGFFSSGVDFWNTAPPGRAPLGPGGAVAGAKKTHEADQTDSTAHIESIWAEPTRLPDGRYGIYIPPSAVLAFLETPSRETLQGYLAWRRERALKLAKAMSLLAEHRESVQRNQNIQRAQKIKQANKPAVTPGQIAPTKPPGIGVESVSRSSNESTVTEGTFDELKILEVIYFSHPKCPACVRQDGVLRDWKGRRRNILLRKITPGQSVELWQRYKVSATPTLVLRAGGREVVLVGLKTADQLNIAIRSITASDSIPHTRKGK